MKYSDQKELNESIVRINEAADRAAALTRQMLAFSRKQVLQMRTVDLNNLVDNMKNIMKRLLGEEYHLFTDLQADPSLIEADSHQVEQIVMNLCINARDAMPQGGKIFLRSRNWDDKVVLIIEDTGDGMAQDILPQIFEPFFTTKRPDKGTGLGLSVIFGIVKQHQGEISVDSTLGEGTIFTIKYKNSTLKGNNPQEIQKKHEYQGGRCILFLEDDEMIREITLTNLEEKNFTVFSAESIKTALELFQLHREEIDIVFSDVVLPDGSGLDFVDRITLLKENMKIILASGYTNEKSHLQNIQRKGFHFIQKPYTINDIVQLISSENKKEEIDEY
ncbi:MAG: ATP-binding protein, partial [Spirochaetaceae bacterium]|jgi:two-component system cell cycle sensor histidine kinase/response regulator CckA|nr:ATP-binding protein [Spirochaetaceae bacterium]